MSDPELFFTPPPPLIFLTFFLSHSLGAEDPTLGGSQKMVTEINRGRDLKSFFPLFFFPPLSRQIDSFACFALIIILGKCSVNVRRMNMNIRCQASLHEISFENYKFHPAANCLAIKAHCV